LLHVAEKPLQLGALGAPAYRASVAATPKALAAAACPYVAPLVAVARVPRAALRNNARGAAAACFTITARHVPVPHTLETALLPEMSSSGFCVPF
jgi:hypothetical protein